MPYRTKRLLGHPTDQGLRKINKARHTLQQTTRKGHCSLPYQCSFFCYHHLPYSLKLHNLSIVQSPVLNPHFPLHYFYSTLTPRLSSTLDYILFSHRRSLRKQTELGYMAHLSAREAFLSPFLSDMERGVPFQALFRLFAGSPPSVPSR